MKLDRRTWLIGGAIVLVVLLGLSALMPGRRPAPEDPPPIPEPIAQAEREEPRLRVWMHEEGRIEEMAFEDYIMGVVAAEMNPNWPIEALSAQAILARTFTLQKIASQGGVPARNAHASTNIEELQAYNADEITDAVREAVQNTRGMVITHNGNYVRAWFHANSGGKTATAEEGLEFTDEPTPYIVMVNDPISQEVLPEEERIWSATFTRAEITQALRQIGQTPGDFDAVEIVERGPSGRVTRFRVGQATVSGPGLRLAVGSTVMRSTLLDDVTVEGDRVTFTGRGYGHGVGMSQWGAKARAEQGSNAIDIINTYYRNVTLQQVWD